MLSGKLKVYADKTGNNQNAFEVSFVIDLSLLSRFLCLEEEVKDEEVTWTWDYVFASVSSEMREEWAQEEDHEDSSYEDDHRLKWSVIPHVFFINIKLSGGVCSLWFVISLCQRSRKWEGSYRISWKANFLRLSIGLFWWIFSRPFILRFAIFHRHLLTSAWFWLLVGLFQLNSVIS